MHRWTLMAKLLFRCSQARSDRCTVKWVQTLLLRANAVPVLTPTYCWLLKLVKSRNYVVLTNQHMERSTTNKWRPGTWPPPPPSVQNKALVNLNLAKSTIDQQLELTDFHQWLQYLLKVHAFVVQFGSVLEWHCLGDKFATGSKK